MIKYILNKKKTKNSLTQNLVIYYFYVNINLIQSFASSSSPSSFVIKEKENERTHARMLIEEKTIMIGENFSLDVRVSRNAHSHTYVDEMIFFMKKKRERQRERTREKKKKKKERRKSLSSCFLLLFIRHYYLNVVVNFTKKSSDSGNVDSISLNRPLHFRKKFFSLSVVDTISRKSGT